MKKILALAVGLTVAAGLNASAAIDVNVIVDTQGDGFIGFYNTATGQTGLSALTYSTKITDSLSGQTPGSYSFNSSLSINSGDIALLVTPTGPSASLFRFNSADPSTMFFFLPPNIPLTKQSGAMAYTESTAIDTTMPSGLSISSGAEGYTLEDVTSGTGFINGSLGGGTISEVNYYIVSSGKVSLVPEPAVFALLAGLAGLLLAFRRSLPQTVKQVAAWVRG